MSARSVSASRTSTAGCVVLLVALAGCASASASDTSSPVVSKPSPVEVAGAAQWRITNDAYIGDHWNIGELEMFSDDACTKKQSDIGKVIYSYWYDHSPKPVVHDGVCNTSGHANPNTWAGSDDRDGKAVRGSWLGYDFREPTTIRCVRVCQGQDHTQWVAHAILQYFNGRRWVDAGMLRLGRGESSSVVHAL